MVKNKNKPVEPEDKNVKKAKQNSISIDDLVKQYITDGEDAVNTAMKENSVATAAELTFSDLKMDSLDVVQLAVKVQDDLGITLSDDEFAKVPQGKTSQGEVIYKPVDKVTLGDITGIINTKLEQK
jgi:acyl carrier protein